MGQVLALADAVPAALTVLIVLLLVVLALAVGSALLRAARAAASRDD